MAKSSAKKQLHEPELEDLLKTLKSRFSKHMKRHKDIDWDDVEKRLRSHPDKMWVLSMMESSGGEPDVVGMDKKTGTIIFYDCSEESPKGRRSFCYDRAALDSRKEHKPKNSAMDMAEELGIEMLNEEEYHELQKLGNFDNKTSSWLKTPDEVRKLGGAIFGDYRFGRVFVYHNGAESYYAARGFRGSLKV